MINFIRDYQDYTIQGAQLFVKYWYVWTVIIFGLIALVALALWLVIKADKAFEKSHPKCGYTDGRTCKTCDHRYHCRIKGSV